MAFRVNAEPCQRLAQMLWERKVYGSGCHWGGFDVLLKCPGLVAKPKEHVGGDHISSVLLIEQSDCQGLQWNICCTEEGPGLKIVFGLK